MLQWQKATKIVAENINREKDAIAIRKVLKMTRDSKTDIQSKIDFYSMKVCQHLSSLANNF